MTNSEIIQVLSTDFAAYKAEFNRINNNFKKEMEYKAKVRELMPDLLDALKKNHFKISKISATKTGMDSDWTDGDYMNVSVTLVPTSSKVKFVPFMGYDAQGRGKNRKRIVAKAERLQDAIKKGTSIESVKVNQFSFEDNATGRTNKNSPNSVLMTFWVK